MKNTVAEIPKDTEVPKWIAACRREFPDLNTADLAEVLERRRISRPESKLDAMVKKLDQKAIKKAAAVAGSDYLKQIELAYEEVSRQLDSKNLI